MAIALDSTANGSNPTRGATSETLAFTMGSVSNGLLLIAVDRDDDTVTAPDDVTSVTYNGVSATQLMKIRSFDGEGWNYIYGLLAPASGTHNIVVTITGTAGSRLYICGVSYSGVKQTGLPDATASQVQTINGVTTTMVITTVANNCWSVMYTMDNGGGTLSASVGATERATGGANSRKFFDSNGPITPLGIYSMTVNDSANSKQTSTGVSFAPAAASTPSFNFGQFFPF